MIEGLTIEKANRPVEMYLGDHWVDADKVMEVSLYRTDEPSNEITIWLTREEAERVRNHLTQALEAR